MALNKTGKKTASDQKQESARKLPGSREAYILEVVLNPIDFARHIRGGSEFDPSKLQKLIRFGEQTSIQLSSKLKPRIPAPDDGTMMARSDMQDLLETKIETAGLSNQYGVRISCKKNPPGYYPKAILFNQKNPDKFIIYDIKVWKVGENCQVIDPFMTVVYKDSKDPDSLKSWIRTSVKGEKSVTRLPYSTGRRVRKLHFKEKEIVNRLIDFPDISPLSAVAELLKKEVFPEEESVEGPEQVGVRMLPKDRDSARMIAYAMSGTHQATITFPSLIVAENNDILFHVARNAGLVDKTINKGRMLAPKGAIGNRKILDAILHALKYAGAESSLVELGCFILGLQDRIPESSYRFHLGVMPGKGRYLPGNGLVLTIQEQHAPPYSILLYFGETPLTP